MAVFKCGPSGNSQGGAFSFSDDAAVPIERITSVTVWHGQGSGAVVAAIQVSYKSGGTVHDFPRNGAPSDAGLTKSVVKLDDDEYITGISGDYAGAVDRVSIHTNKQVHGPFGGSGGQISYQYHCPEGIEVVGFWGQHWPTFGNNQVHVITSLGVILRKKP